MKIHATWLAVTSGLLAAVFLAGQRVGFESARAEEKPARPDGIDRLRNLDREREEGVKVPEDRGAVPQEGQLYVWPVPEVGTQTVLVLRVHDGDTLEGAFLVPAVFRLAGCDAPELNTDAGKASAEAFNKLVGGKLLPANLYGREKYGRVLADFWLGKAEAPTSPQGWASKWQIKNGFAKEWSGKGKKPN